MKKRHAILILLLFTQTIIFAVTKDTFIVNDLSDSLIVKFECSKNSMDEYEGIISVYLRGNDIPIITDKFIDSDKSLSKFCPDDIISEKPIEPNPNISYKDQKIIYLRDKNFDDIEDIIIINKRDMRRYVSTIYINTGSTFENDKLITEAYNWYDIEVNANKRIIYASGIPSITSSRSAKYFIKDGRISSHTKYVSDVMSNNYIEKSSTEKYSNGKLISTERTERISLKNDAIEVFSFQLDEGSMKAYFISSKEKIHFALEDTEKKEVIYFFPFSYPYESKIKAFTSGNESIIDINNKDFQFKLSLDNEKLTSIILLANNSNSDDQDQKVDIETVKGNYLDILKFKNVVKE